jgi:segregation and condensation protein A
VVVESVPKWSATLYDLLTAYASMRQRTAVSQVTIAARQVWSLQDAREILSRLIGNFDEWAALDDFLLRYLPDPAMRVTALASSFAATLELVREGSLQLRQEKNFAPIFLRAAKAGDRRPREVTDSAKSV